MDLRVLKNAELSAFLWEEPRSNSIHLLESQKCWQLWDEGGLNQEGLEISLGGNCVSRCPPLLSTGTADLSPPQKKTEAYSLERTKERVSWVHPVKLMVGVPH